MSGPKEILVNELSIGQLNQLSQQLDQEMELLQSSLSSLKVAQTRFTECNDSLSKISSSPDNTNKDVLVPLTSSMYVTGQLTNIETVLVDVGTGYYVEMKIAAAKDYYQRKVEFLTQQMEKIQPALQEKYQMKEVIVEVLQSKVQAQLAAQQHHSSASMSTALAKS